MFFGMSLLLRGVTALGESAINTAVYPIARFVTPGPPSTRGVQRTPTYTIAPGWLRPAPLQPFNQGRTENTDVCPIARLVTCNLEGISEGFKRVIKSVMLQVQFKHVVKIFA